MKMVRRGSPAKFYITAAAALVYATSAPLYEPYHFVIFAAVLGAGVFWAPARCLRAKRSLCPSSRRSPRKSPKRSRRKEEKSHTGNPEVDKIIDEGREYLKKLRAADDAIPDEDPFGGHHPHGAGPARTSSATSPTTRRSPAKSANS